MYDYLITFIYILTHFNALNYDAFLALECFMMERETIVLRQQVP